MSPLEWRGRSVSPASRVGPKFPLLLTQLGGKSDGNPPTAHDIRRALQTLSRAGAPVDLLEALEAWSADQSRQVA